MLEQATDAIAKFIGETTKESLLARDAFGRNLEAARVDNMRINEYNRKDYHWPNSDRPDIGFSRPKSKDDEYPPHRGNTHEQTTYIYRRNL